MADSGALALIGTTFFHLPNGTLITLDKTTVAKALHEIVTPGGRTMTHITGASGDDNAIIGGLGRFEKSTGAVCLSGMVDLSSLEAGNTITFDCLYVVDLD